METQMKRLQKPIVLPVERYVRPPNSDWPEYASAQQYGQLVYNTVHAYEFLKRLPFGCYFLRLSAVTDDLLVVEYITPEGRVSQERLVQDVDHTRPERPAIWSTSLQDAEEDFQVLPEQLPRLYEVPGTPLFGLRPYWEADELLHTCRVGAFYLPPQRYLMPAELADVLTPQQYTQYAYNTNNVTTLNHNKTGIPYEPFWTLHKSPSMLQLHNYVAETRPQENEHEKHNLPLRRRPDGSTFWPVRVGRTVINMSSMQLDSVKQLIPRLAAYKSLWS